MKTTAAIQELFAAAEAQQKTSRRVFDEQAESLHLALLQLQRDLDTAKIPVVIIIAGVEGAGKGEVVRLLHRWFDTRGLETYAFWDETDDERQRPHYWRFWRALPAAGRMSILFGSWYTRPITDRALRRARKKDLARHVERIGAFEKLLHDDGTLLIKIWLHVSPEVQATRLDEVAAGKRRGSSVSHLTKEFSSQYKRFLKISTDVLARTNSAHAPWHVIGAVNDRSRDLEVGRLLLERGRAQLARINSDAPKPPPVPVVAPLDAAPPLRLSDVDLSATLTRESYRRRLGRLQNKLYDLSWAARRRGIGTIAVFEGWDAAGKGGAIRRVTQAMDPRLYRVVSIAAPTDEERSHHYLWRFWRQVPRQGYQTIYDRSWYGRVLVERVEGFAAEHAWSRAYAEINEFEAHLSAGRMAVLKVFIHIDADEQLRRFREREVTPTKHHKITDEDWRNRDRWQDYEAAIDDMLKGTSTSTAPWVVVPGNDKYVARVRVLEAYCDCLQRRLDAADAA